MTMSSAGRRVRSAVGSRLARAALLVGCVVPVLLSGGVATASATTNPCTSAPTPVASVPTNPFGANVTILDPSMSVASINAALNATPPAGRRQAGVLLPAGHLRRPLGHAGDGDDEQRHSGGGRRRHGCRGPWREPM